MLLYRTSLGMVRDDARGSVLVDLPNEDIAGLLASGTDTIREARVLRPIALEGLTMLSPVEPHGRVILNGANYTDHVEEAGMPMPETPLFLDIPDSGLCAADSDILLPTEAPDNVDYEGELTLIISRAGRDIAKADAWRHVGGLTIGNDISARDVQLSGMRDGVIVDLDCVRRGKSFPTFSPLGPGVLVVESPADLAADRALNTRVNGEIRQQGRTGEMIFDIPTVVEHVSRRFELQVGDVILTGTPGGVALASGRYLRAGDVVEVEVEGLGTLRNTIVAST